MLSILSKEYPEINPYIASGKFKITCNQCHITSKYKSDDIKSSFILKGRLDCNCGYCHINLSERNTIINKEITFSKIRKYTNDIIVERGRKIHHYDYDYSMIKEFKNKDSKITLMCNKCINIVTPSINNHINGRYGCSGCYGNLPYTLDTFIKKSKVIHGEKFDYSKIKDTNIKGANSLVPLKCNKCMYEWKPKINDHINAQSGCPNCSGNVTWNFNRFKKRLESKKIGKYDFSDPINKDIKHSKSTVVLKCLVTCNNIKCGYIITTNVANIIHNNNTGCKKCNKQLPWTKDRFLEEALKIHANKYVYFGLDAIDGGASIIEIESIDKESCNHRWKHTVHYHIHSKRGCPKCSITSKYDLEKFKNKAMEFHGDTYIYTDITDDHFKNGSKSKIPIICRQHGQFEMTIDSHIHGKNGCSTCSNNLPWTYERFKIESLKHTDKCFDDVKPNDITGNKSYFPVKCKKCDTKWRSNILNMIVNNHQKCPKCHPVFRWTPLNFVKIAREKHGYRFIYDGVTNINSIQSKIGISTANKNTCNHRWVTTVSNHIYNMSGCPYCNITKTTRWIADHIKDHNISVEFEKMFNWCKNPETNRYLPFDIHIPDYNIIIEVDGKQHFEHTPYFTQPTGDKLIKRDIYKMKQALTNNISVIRIYQPDLKNNFNKYKDKIIEEILRNRNRPDIICIANIDNIYKRHRIE